MRQIVNDCLGELNDEFRPVQLKLQEAPSNRKLEPRTGVHTSSVYCQLHEAHEPLKPAFERRGIDADLMFAPG
jgi:hypothetical protein